MSEKTPVYTKNAPPPLPGVMNQAVVANGVVYCSGVLPADPATGRLIRGDIQAHTHQCIINLGAVLEAAGSSLHDVVEVNIFLSDMINYNKMNEVYKMYWGEVKPARTCVAVRMLPLGTDIEIKCIGLVKKTQSKL